MASPTINDKELVKSPTELNHGSQSSNNQSLFHSLCEPENEPNQVFLDHCYAKPWNCHPDSNHARPAKMLFMKGIIFDPTLDMPIISEEVNVETIPKNSLPPYDKQRAAFAMRESERFCSGINIEGHSDSEDWEENVSKQSWTPVQRRIFSKAAKILNSDRLSKLVYQKNANEPIMRRLSVDKVSGRFRQLFSSSNWDMNLLQWLHHTLEGVLPRDHLGSYYDVLQTLKAKVPSLIEKMLSKCKVPDGFSHLLKRPWDPVSSLLNQHKLKKLPGNPLIVWTPGDPAYSCVGFSKRMKFWHSHLSAMGRLVTVNPQVNQGVTIGESLDAIITAVRYEVVELKMNFPSRPIILVGWTIGALIACQVAIVEPVAAVICLGFPLTGVNGSRGDLDDPLLESRTPTLFVVGQNANMCSVDDIEDFRDRMKAESGLVVIGGGDDHLRVSKLKKHIDGITQVMVDRCIFEEIFDFLTLIMSHPADGNFEATETPKKKRKSNQEYSQPESLKKNRNRNPSGSPVSSSTESSSTGSSATDMGETKIRRLNCHMTEPTKLTFKRVSPSTSLSHSSLGAPRMPDRAAFSHHMGLNIRPQSVSFSPPAPPKIAPFPALQGDSQLLKELSTPIKINQTLSKDIANRPIQTQHIRSHYTPSTPRNLAPKPEIRPCIQGVTPVKKILSVPTVINPSKNVTFLGSPIQQRLPNSISYLTLSNPMLSNILDSDRNAKISPKSSPYIASAVPISSQQLGNRSFLAQPSPNKKPTGIEGIRTYLRTPGHNGSGKIINRPISMKRPVTNSSQSFESPISSSSIGNLSYTVSNPKSSLLHSALNTSKVYSPTGNSRKMQVITFLKPPTISCEKNNNPKVTQLNKDVVSKEESSLTECITNSVNNIPSSNLVISKEVVDSGESEKETETKDNILVIEIDSENELVISPLKVLPAETEKEDPVVKNVERNALKAEAVQETIDSSELVSESAREDLNVPAKKIDEEKEESVKETEKTDEKNETITGEEIISERFSHLSAGMQEAVLALTQLGEYDQMALSALAELSCGLDPAETG